MIAHTKLNDFNTKGVKPYTLYGRMGELYYIRGRSSPPPATMLHYVLYHAVRPMSQAKRCPLVRAVAHLVRVRVRGVGYSRLGLGLGLGSGLGLGLGVGVGLGLPRPAKEVCTSSCAPTSALPLSQALSLTANLSQAGEGTRQKISSGSGRGAYRGRTSNCGAEATR